VEPTVLMPVPVTYQPLMFEGVFPEGDGRAGIGIAVRHLAVVLGAVIDDSDALGADADGVGPGRSGDVVRELVHGRRAGRRYGRYLLQAVVVLDVA